MDHRLPQQNICTDSAPSKITSSITNSQTNFAGESTTHRNGDGCNLCNAYA